MIAQKSHFPPAKQSTVMESSMPVWSHLNVKNHFAQCVLSIRMPALFLPALHLLHCLCPDPGARGRSLGKETGLVAEGSWQRALPPCWPYSRDRTNSPCPADTTALIFVHPLSSGVKSTPFLWVTREPGPWAAGGSYPEAHQAAGSDHGIRFPLL